MSALPIAEQFPALPGHDASVPTGRAVSRGGAGARSDGRDPWESSALDRCVPGLPKKMESADFL